MKLIDALEVEALDQLAEIRSYRSGGGQKERAKVALGVIGSYVRLRATLANERTNELVAARLGLSAQEGPKLIEGE
jgi:hypothetical protein